MGTLLHRYSVLLVLLQGLFIASIAVAADKPADFDKQVRSWDRTIERIINRVQSGRSGSLEDRDLRRQLKDITDAAALGRDAALKQAKQIKGLMDALGPQPAADAKPEAEAIQKRRKELGGELATHEGQAKQVDLIIAKAEQALSEIGQRSRERLKATLLERTLTPLSPAAWAIAVPEAIRLLKTSFIEAPETWWASVQNTPDVQTLLLRNFFIALAAATAVWLLGWWLRARYGRAQSIEAPDYGCRLLAGLVEGGSRALAPITFVLLVNTLVLDVDSIKGPLATVVQASTTNLLLFFLGSALINAVLTPQRPDWSLFGFSGDVCKMLVFRLRLALVVFFGIGGLRQAVSWATPSAELDSVSAFVFTLILIPLLVSVLISRAWTPDKGTAHKLPRLRIVLTLTLVTFPFAAALGYPGLTTYLTGATVMSFLVLGGFGVLRGLGREGLVASLDSSRPVGQRVRDFFALNQESSDRARFWIRVLFDSVLLVAAGLALLPVWGFGAEETAISTGKLMRGVQIGSYTFSLINLLIGLFLFAIIVFLTGFAQKGLERHILPNLTRDKGVRDALKTGVGYVGVVVAALIAISAIGLDLTNLALIAGALSVGLGFGLQNVVNNFVSGLILLAERPIKPGDWVVIGGHEGTVKKVNVRSTEVETFQKASVIIPNADLISTPVVNWTHKNLLGRADIRVGVAYGTDPKIVESVLLDCARAHPNVIANPEPSVLFIDFGESSLDFELRAYLANVEKRLQTGSEIRFAMHDAFKEKGIEIPFPQRVLHFTSPPPGIPLPETEKA